jgi:MoaA/NifB/PqqE/SkfB family radical SAM enzyme
MKGYFDLAKNVVVSNFTRLDFPYKLTFVATYWCNYRCKTCNIWRMKPQDELTLQEIEEFFRKSTKFNWIDFTGGEVWLRKDFTDIVAAALRYCPNLVAVHFPTNGYLTEQIVRGVQRIIEMRPAKLIITVSTDGDEAVNDDVRGIKGGWRRQIETYRRLHALGGVKVLLGMTLSALNADQYDKAFAAAKAECPWLEPKDFHINIAHESAHYYRNVGSGTTNQDTEQIVRQVGRYRSLRGLPLHPFDILERRYLKHAEKYLRTGLTPVRCHALHSSCFIDSWGNVYPCGMYNAKIANIRDYGLDLQTVWNLSRTRQLQEEIWEYRCPQCWTPCEAYQSLLGNLFGLRNRRTAPVPGPSSETA